PLVGRSSRIRRPLTQFLSLRSVFRACAHLNPRSFHEHLPHATRTRLDGTEHGDHEWECREVGRHAIVVGDAVRTLLVVPVPETFPFDDRLVAGDAQQTYEFGTGESGIASPHTTHVRVHPRIVIDFEFAAQRCQLTLAGLPRDGAWRLGALEIRFL